VDFNTASGKQDISIPLTDIFNPNNYYTKSEVDTEVNKKYTKPSGGIPKTDMSSDVQLSLEKANSALQEHQDISGKADKNDTYTKDDVDQLLEQQNEEIQESLDEKANIDGYYETLGAGTATNLKGDSVKEGTFTYRPTAGFLDIESGAAPDGGAYLENIKGNTVSWNQLLLNADDWVDMGLPSGTLWCKKNIDVTQPNGLAASPFQYGCSFFSWGNSNIFAIMNPTVKAWNTITIIPTENFMKKNFIRIFNIDINFSILSNNIFNVLF
jgi:hypothetical protein